jgi:NCS1 family nucleobase:cation symporter-1
LNIPDFTRYARSQRDQSLGQLIGLPTTMGFYAFVGLAATCAALVVFPHILVTEQAPWDPVDLLKQFKQPVLVVGSMFFLLVATLTTNIAANVVAPANGFSNLAPRRISFRMGGVIAALLGILMMPWKLAEDPSGFIYTWLIGYSALLGPIAGIMIADYYLVRRTRLELAELFRPGGIFDGVNWGSRSPQICLDFSMRSR